MKKQEINWQKINNLLPVIVQHATTCEVLMLGYMNRGVGENLGGEESNVLFPYEESPVDKGGNLGTFFECRGYELGL